MRTAKLGVKSFSNDPARLDDHAADQRIGLNPTATAASQLKGTRKKTMVRFAVHCGRIIWGQLAWTAQVSV